MTRKLKPKPRYDLDVKALDDKIMARHENTFRALAEGGNHGHKPQFAPLTNNR